MKTKLFVLLLAAATLASAPLALADCGKCGPGAEAKKADCPMHAKAESGCAMHAKAEENCPMKQAAARWDRIDNGVRLTFTSDKPEVVKALQQHAEKCASMGMGMGGSCCGHAKAEGKGAGCGHAKAEGKEAGCCGHGKVEGKEAGCGHAKAEGKEAGCGHAKVEGKEAGCGHAKVEGKEAGCCGHGKTGGKEAACPMKDAKRQVAKTENGVTVTFTSEKQDVVKYLQDNAGKCPALGGKSDAQKT